MAQQLDTSILSGTDLAQARSACVLIHGRGQTPASMGHVITRLKLEGVAYLLPASGGAGWYDARAVDPLNDITLAQMNAGLDRIEAGLTSLAASRPGLPVMLAGFSQGACLVTEMLLRRTPRLAGAAILTGCRVGVACDASPERSLGGLPVYASNGDNDPWIPQGAFFQMLASLTGAGARLRADLLPGRAHEVSDLEISVLRGMLREIMAGAKPLTEDT